MTGKIVIASLPYVDASSSSSCIEFSTKSQFYTMKGKRGEQENVEAALPVENLLLGYLLRLGQMV